MGGRTHDEIEARYQNSFGVRAGYLPRDRAVLDQWHTELARHLDSAALTGEHTPEVQELADLLDIDPIVRMYVTEMIEQAQHLPRQGQRRDTVRNVPELLAALDKIVSEPPVYKKIAFPMSALFAYMMMTTAGEAIFRGGAFNEVLRKILKAWCKFLDSDRSRTELRTSEGGWLSPDAVTELNLEDFEIDKSQPYWGFTSWNDFFHREIRPEKRPVSSPDDPRVIVSANDGHVYKFAANVKKQDIFWAKGQPYSLSDMLHHHDEYINYFSSGGTGPDVIQSFLSGNDYHRFVAPIAGTVRYKEIVPGLMFSNAESAGFDPGAGVLSQGYEVAVNTRGIVVIESPEASIGKVCVIPVGITEVSSITLCVEVDHQVRKGDPLGYFSFGGSTLCMVFRPGVIDYYTLRAPRVDDPDAGPQGSINSIIRAKEQIASAQGAWPGAGTGCCATEPVAP